MTGPTEANGFLVITAINKDIGEAGSETYALQSVEGEGDRAAYHATDGDGMAWVISQRPEAMEALEVEPYRDLIRALIAADEPCQGFGCSITMLGHLLMPCTPEQQDLVRALDPSQQAKP